MVLVLIMMMNLIQKTFFVDNDGFDDTDYDEVEYNPQKLFDVSKNYQKVYDHCYYIGKHRVSVILDIRHQKKFQ